MAYGPGQAYPPYPAAPALPVSAGVNPSWLAGSADRERTVGVLRAGFTEGRLSQDELDDRVAQAYAARTYGDLWALTADLPAGPLPYPPGLAYPQGPYQQSPAVLYESESPSHWHSAAALVITALVIFTLAALVTAIATAHGQPAPFQQFQQVQPAQVLPFQQQVQLPQQAPLQHVQPASWLRSSRAARGEVGHAPRPVRPKNPFQRGFLSPGWVDRAATNASCGTSTRPIVFIRFLPSFCFSSSFRLRVMSPP